jgi:serine/threonine protein kinase
MSPSTPARVAALLQHLGAGAAPGDGAALLALLDAASRSDGGAPRAAAERAVLAFARRRVAAAALGHGVLTWRDGGSVALGGFLKDGAFGTVLAATDAQGRAVAVKLVCAGACATVRAAAGAPPRSGSRSRSRRRRGGAAAAAVATAFLTELAVHATLMADGLDGDGVPRLHRVGVVDAGGAPAFVLVMERLRGDLRDLLLRRVAQRDAPRDAPRALVPWAVLQPALADVAALFRAFHERYAFVHRDAKYNNVMYAGSAGAGARLKLIDFGFACLTLGPLLLRADGSRFDRVSPCGDARRDLATLLATTYELLPLTADCKAHVRAALALARTPPVAALDHGEAHPTPHDLIDVLRRRGTAQRRAADTRWQTLYDRHGTLWPLVDVPGANLAEW